MNSQKTRVGNMGFTLIEVSVAVVCIGVLAAVAYPVFSKFQARARQSEAKAHLHSAFTAMKSRYAEVNDFSVITLTSTGDNSFASAGFVPEGNSVYNFVGNGKNNNDSILCTASGCMEAEADYKGPNKGGKGKGASHGLKLGWYKNNKATGSCSEATAIKFGKKYFILKAIAQLDDDPAADVWSIDSGRNLHNADALASSEKDFKVDGSLKNPPVAEACNDVINEY